MPQDDHHREALRLAIERRARAEALVHDERLRIDALASEVAALQLRASRPRRAVAALAGSRLWALMARIRLGQRLGARSWPEPYAHPKWRAGSRDLDVVRLRDAQGRIAVEERRRAVAARVAAGSRRQRFRLARRRRVLEHGLCRSAIAGGARLPGLRLLSPPALLARLPVLRIPLRTHRRLAAAGGRSPNDERDFTLGQPTSVSIILIAPPLAALRAGQRIVRSDFAARELVVVLSWRGGRRAAAVAKAAAQLKTDIAIIAVPSDATPVRLRQILDPLLSDAGLDAVAQLAARFDWEEAAPRPVGAATRPGGPAARPAVALAGRLAALRVDLLRRHPPCPAYRGDLWLTDFGLAAATAGRRLAVVPEHDDDHGRHNGHDHHPDDEALLLRRWGPTIRQRVLVDLLAGGGEWCARPARVLVEADVPPALTEAVVGLGLECVSDVADADVAIGLDAEGRLTCDWILSGERGVAVAAPVTDSCATSCSSRNFDAAALATTLSASARAASFCVRIGARDWEAARQGGDAALARSLAHALGERGHQALLQADADAGRPAGHCLDVLLVLRGRRAGEPTPGRLNLIWQISHPDEVRALELDRYDRVLVASRPYARRQREDVRPPVEALLQFTDPRLFHPATDVARRTELAFVGNWRGTFRRIVSDALATDRPLALYGRGWDLLAPDHAVAEHVPHHELHRVYSSCDVLLCDHWDDMREHGFISNRIFDALASGAFVISDDNPALDEELPGAVITYADGADLRRKLDHYLTDREERVRIAQGGRDMVLARHTAGHRADELLAIVRATANASERLMTAHL